ncbi:DUF2268 domain-containing protein [Saccharibacillus alkalitolerans]|uniref:DUF2268 domain-containing protein n=1 Tax=Saccharibacillus alkalitolerans TaxID=2705290 RepID=A0ABX0F353_9BACL|nr:DUF2268 domain-containing putative Zn-dependent protease [Saccharibacillus alkalitolerans]NGZ74374.1 hypothetical protein [Saccharibacillus alkalitolerans]
MKIEIEDTIGQYERCFALAEEKRADNFRFEMMGPFERMWNAIGVPLRSPAPGGYDVVMAADMLGYLPLSDSERGLRALEEIKRMRALDTVRRTLNDCMLLVEKAGLQIEAVALKFGLYLANPDKLKLQKGYCGFGGIPGFVQVSIFPNEYNKPRLPAIVAHEFNHNLRFSHAAWNHGNVTVGDYLVIEGLAECFAEELYGSERLGPWVEEARKGGGDFERSVSVFGEALGVKGFAEVAGYMFGDEIAREQGYAPVGLPPFAGYAVGYAAVRSFLKRTGVGIAEASILGTEEIIRESGFFAL